MIDEADSFIYSREMVINSWERSQINEFLTDLEECRGFCICTTNQRASLDQAAMRRFSFKVAFDYAKPAQVAALYDKLLAPLCRQPLAGELRQRLLGISKLTPGDFHAVRSRYSGILAAAKDIQPAALIDELARECALKLEEGSARIGFN